MGLDTDQTLVQISVCYVILETLVNCKAIAAVKTRRVAEQGIKDCRQIILNWPGWSNRWFTKTKRDEFVQYLLSIDDYGTHNARLGYLLEFIVLDIMDEGLVGDKLAMMAPLRDCAEKIREYFDPNAANIPAMDMAKTVDDELRRIIWWNRNHKEWR